MRYNSQMVKRLLVFFLFVFPVSAFAQSAGTLILPTGHAVITAPGLSLDLNGQFMSKFDFAAAGPLASVQGASPSAVLTAEGAALASTVGQPNGIAALTSSGGLQAPTTSVTGGVLSSTAGTNQFMTGITTSGAPTYAQPSFANISGTIGTSQIPVATTSTLGGVIVGAGLGVSSGALSVNYGTAANTAAQGNDTRFVNVCFTTGCTFTGTLTPSTTAGIVGTTTANNANAGSVGEYITAQSSASVSTPTGTLVNLISVTLTPGDWDVTGSELLNCAAATASNAYGGLTTSSGTLPAWGNYWQYQSSTDAGLNTLTESLPYVRFNVTTNTVVYAVAGQNCPSGSPTGVGGIVAHRVR
jgi:hypothetical protein